LAVFFENFDGRKYVDNDKQFDTNVDDIQFVVRMPETDCYEESRKTISCKANWTIF